MFHLAESTVQEAAISHLRRYYRRRSWGRTVYAQAEARTKGVYGNKRADGLLVFQHWLWGETTVSLEAKSYKTLPAIRPVWNFKLWLINSLRAGMVICILTGLVVALWRMDDWLWAFILLMNSWLLGALAYGLISRHHPSHRTVGVLQQLSQYPAHEQWLAFSQDSWSSLKTKDREVLLIMCRQHRTGLLLVSGQRKVKKLLKPRRQRSWGKNYLDHYSKSQQIRQEVFS